MLTFVGQRQKRKKSELSGMQLDETTWPQSEEQSESQKTKQKVADSVLKSASFSFSQWKNCNQNQTKTYCISMLWLENDINAFLFYTFRMRGFSFSMWRADTETLTEKKKVQLFPLMSFSYWVMTSMTNKSEHGLSLQGLGEVFRFEAKFWGFIIVVAPYQGPSKIVAIAMAVYP